MSAHRVASLFVALPLLVCGCAMYRTVEVEAVRVEVESSRPAGLTPSLATDLFQDVAKEVGYSVRGPIRVSDTMYEYVADASGPKRRIQAQLVLWVEDKRIRFESGIFGTRKDFPTAQSAAALFEQALDKRSIQYKTRIWKTPPIGL